MTRKKWPVFLSAVLLLSSLCTTSLAGEPLQETTAERLCPGQKVAAEETDLNRDAENDISLEEGFATGLWFNQAGYLTHGRKTAFLVCSAAGAVGQSFSLVDRSGQTVFTGTSGVSFYDAVWGIYLQELDFSSFTVPGSYRLQAGDRTGAVFAVSDEVYRDLEESALELLEEYRADTGTETGDISRDMAYIQTGWEEGSGIETNQGERDVTGGWYDGKTLSKTVEIGAGAVWKLQSLYEAAMYIGREGRFLDENGNGCPDLLDTAWTELQFLLTMQREDGMEYSAVESVLLGDTPVRVLRPVSAQSTLALAAVCAQGGRLWQKWDPDRAEELLNAAKRAYAALKDDPADFADESLTEDFYWAACELYAATGETGYGGDVKASLGFWGQCLGTLTLAWNDERLTTAEKELLDQELEKTLSQMDGAAAGDKNDLEWLMDRAYFQSAAVLLGLRQDSDGAQRAMDALLGANPGETSYEEQLRETGNPEEIASWYAAVFLLDLIVPSQVTFDPVGGSCDVLTLDTGKTGTLAALPVPEREGCEFLGWYTETGKKVTIAMVYPESTTVYALWQGSGRIYARAFGDQNLISGYISSGKASASGWGRRTSREFVLTLHQLDSRYRVTDFRPSQSLGPETGKSFSNP